MKAHIKARRLKFYHSYRFSVSVLAIGATALLSACSDGPSDKPVAAKTLSEFRVTDAMLRNSENRPQEWLTYGGTYEEQRHTTLSQITKENINALGLAWSYDLATARGVEATPIVVDGVMYVTGAWSIVYAVDAKTGEELWVYDPEVSGEDAVKGCCDVVNRGVAVYDDKVYVGVFDGRLEALDAKTGAVIWSKVTVDQTQPYTITMAPRIANGRVIIGNSGGELGVRGYVSAYDANTGEMDWRFYTVPNPNKQPDGAASDEIFTKLANDSWGDTGAWTTDGGGGTAWDSIIFDQVNNTLIVGVGNGAPWNPKVRDPEGNGDNLFLSSILALDADTGEYKWHFQTTPRDQWDYTAVQSLILADLPLGENGKDRRVVMQAPKNGFFYVLDAATGEFISGEAFTLMNWATGLDKNGRPIEASGMRDTTGDGQIIIPGPLGAHNWHPMAYSPKTKLAYIPAQTIPQIFKDEPAGSDPDAYWNTGYDFSAGLPLEYPEGTLDAFRSFNSGSLLAWDPVKQEAAWSVDLGGPWNGGVMTTETNLVFQGTTKGQVHAYDAETGERVWSHNVKSGALSGWSSYEIDGEQYVTTTTGWGSAFALAAGYGYEYAVAPNVGRIVTFKLGGQETVPEPMISAVEALPKAEKFGDAAMLQTGLTGYAQNCSVCHGPLAISSGVLPDLRWSYVTANDKEWRDVLMNGSLAELGMVSFKEQITPEQSEAIRAYVLHQAHQSVALGDTGVPEK